MAKTPVISIQTLREKSNALDKKHKIDKMEAEISALFSSFGITLEAMHDAFKSGNPNIIMDAFSEHKVDSAQAASYAKKLGDIRKKYKYESYLRAGRLLREKFIKSRKTNPIHILKMKANIRGKVTNSNKIEMLYMRQYIFAVAIDRVIKFLSPTPITIHYENLEGKKTSMRVGFKKSSIDEATMDVEAPLIDRTPGKTLFDSFFLHSFYNVEAERWEYIPVELIYKFEGVTAKVLLEGLANGSF